MKRMIILLVLVLLLTSGCWNRREPELVAVVLGVGFDYLADQGQYRVIVQIANPQGLAQGDGSGGGGGPAPAFWTVSAHGRNPFEALRNLSEGVSRELLFAHSTVILFSEELARHGIADALDVLERERQFRTIARPAVVQGEMRTLLESPFPIDLTGAQGLVRQIDTLQMERAVFPTRIVGELYNAYAQPGREMIIGRVQVMLDELPGEENLQAATPPARTEGAAIFRDDKMVGWVESDVVAGWLLLHGRARRAVIVIESPEEDDLMGMEITHVSSNLKSQASPDGVSITVELEAGARIQNYAGSDDLQQDSKYVQQLENALAETLRQDILRTISQAQSLNSDFIGFGNLIYRQQPKVWNQLEHDWDRLFADVTVDVRVQTNILRSGLISTPMRQRR